MKQKTKGILGRFIAPRFMTSLVLGFAEREGILGIAEDLKEFTGDEILNTLQKGLGYRLNDRTRKRMISVLFDLLSECGYLNRRGEKFIWNARGRMLEDTPFPASEKENALGGMFRFFSECISHAGPFLRGAPAPLDFGSEHLDIWDAFLGNEEFAFARDILVKMLFINRQDRAKILDLCYGPGYDILQIQAELPSASIVALDFTDVFRPRAMERTRYPEQIEWIDSSLWQGFGSPLPFEDESFDIVFFACADPYIPAEDRDFVYRDIFRILKKGGSLGLVTNIYPDPERRHVREAWIRRGNLSHDFLESVCRGWQGFHGAEGAIGLFRVIGYTIHTIMLNASVWRLDRA